MAEKQETSTDIIAEMRGARTEFPFVYLMGEADTPEVIDLRTKEIIEPRKINIRRVTVKELADRFEAALKRESGNYAKLREALEAAKNFVDNVGKAALSDNIDAITICQCAAKLSGRIEAALAEPARNCDVGTPEEQRERFSNFCTNNTDPEDIDGWRCDKRCPLYKDHPNCGWEWLHLPYASEATPCSE